MWGCFLLKGSGWTVRLYNVTWGRPRSNDKVIFLVWKFWMIFLIYFLSFLIWNTSMKLIGRLDFLSSFEPSLIHSIWNRKRTKIFYFHQNSDSDWMLLNLIAHQGCSGEHHETTLLNLLVCHMMVSSVPLAVHCFMLWKSYVSISDERVTFEFRTDE